MVKQAIGWHAQPLMLLVLMFLVQILFCPCALSPRTLSPDGLSQNMLCSKSKSGFLDELR